MKIDTKMLEHLTRNGVQIPKHTLEAMVRYLIYGLHPGSFLERMITKDVYNACFCADFENKKFIADIMKCIEFNFPADCYGSEEKLCRWCGKNDEQRRKYLEEQGFLHTLYEVLKEPNPNDVSTDTNLF